MRIVYPAGSLGNTTPMVVQPGDSEAAPELLTQTWIKPLLDPEYVAQKAMEKELSRELGAQFVVGKSGDKLFLNRSQMFRLTEDPATHVPYQELLDRLVHEMVTKDGDVATFDRDASIVRGWSSNGDAMILVEWLDYTELGKKMRDQQAKLDTVDAEF